MLLPNIPTITLGGEFFWKTIEEIGEWKLQKNIITKHYRILDDKDRRQAWSLHGKKVQMVFHTLMEKVI